MRNLTLLTILMAGTAWPQQIGLEANSIVVTAARTVVLAPTDVTFMLTVNVDVSVPLEQVLSIVDFGLTANDLAGVGSYPGYMPPYGGPATFSPSRITYSFRLSVPIAKMKDTLDKLDKLRKSTDTGIDLNYSTAAVGPASAAVDEAHEKALPELMADARKRAQSIASAAQLKLGAIQSVSESYAPPAGYGSVVQPIVTFSTTVRFAAQP